jgi:hypothetical protein
MEEENESEVDSLPVSQSLESITRKIQIKTKGKVFAVVRESYLRYESERGSPCMNLDKFYIP